MTDTTGWTVMASSTKDDDVTTYGPQFAIDGTDATFFATSSVTSHPWIQVDLGVSSVHVKGLVLKSQDGVCCAAQYLETRIGDEDASDVVPGEKICMNVVCHTTHRSLAGEKRFYCSTPLSGRYVSVQKYRTDNGDWTLELAEIQILRLDPVRNTDKEYWRASSSGRFIHNFALHAINDLPREITGDPKYVPSITYRYI